MTKQWNLHGSIMLHLPCIIMTQNLFIWKMFFYKHHPERKECVVCEYQQKGNGKYKGTKTSNFCRKFNNAICKYYFEKFHTKSRWTDKVSVKNLKQWFHFISVYYTLSRVLLLFLRIEFFLFDVLYISIKFWIPFS